MSDELWKKWSNDWKKGINKAQQDITNFFKLPTKADSEVKSNENEQESNTNVTTAVDKEDQSAESSSPTPNDQKQILANWNQFTQSSQSTIEKWQQEWTQNFQKMQEHLKRSNDKTKAQLQEANENMVNFFDNTQKQVSVFFNKVNLDLQAKSQESREKFIEGLQGINQNWSTFVNKQQKEFEKSMGGWNKWVWKAQLQFVFWLIPIVILFLVILGLIRTFLPGLIPGL